MTSPSTTAATRRRSAIPRGWTASEIGSPRPRRGTQGPELERLWELYAGLTGTPITRYEVSGIERVCVALREAADLPVGEVFEMDVPPGLVGVLVPGQVTLDVARLRTQRPAMAKRLLADEMGRLLVTLSRDGVSDPAALVRAVALLEPLVHPLYR